MSRLLAMTTKDEKHVFCLIFLNHCYKNLNPRVACLNALGAGYDRSSVMN